MSNTQRDLTLGFLAGMLGAAVYNKDLDQADYWPKLKEVLADLNMPELTELETIQMTKMLSDTALFVLQQKEQKS